MISEAKIETIEVDDSSLESLGKKLNSLEYPALHIGERSMYFNTAFRIVLNNKYTHVRIKTSSEYVVFSPTNIKTDDSFRLSVNKSSRGFWLNLPANLREKKLQRGTYKLYRCKQGFAIKRYEPMEVDE